LHIHYDSRVDREALLEALEDCERRIPDLDDLKVPSRVVISTFWDDSRTQLAFAIYTKRAA